MGVAGFMSELFESHTVRLTRTVRPYFLQSVSLVNACRAIQIHCTKHNSGDPDELRQIMQLVQYALEKSTSREVRDQSNPKVNKAFALANQVIDAYLEKYAINGNPYDKDKFSDFQSSARSAAEKDKTATQHMTDVREYVKKRMEIVRRLESVEFQILLWPEIVVQKGTYKSHRVFFVIEENATLDILLVRVLSAVHDLAQKGVPHFSLVQNPQFFQHFPKDRQTWREQSKATPNSEYNVCSVPSIEPLHVFKRVTHWGKEPVFHLIVDRKSGIDRDEVAMFDSQKVNEIITRYKNIWRLEDRQYIARVPTGALVLVETDGKSPYGSSGSSATLVSASGTLNRQQIVGRRPNPSSNESLASSRLTFQASTPTAIQPSPPVTVPQLSTPSIPVAPVEANQVTAPLREAPSMPNPTQQLPTPTSPVASALNSQLPAGQGLSGPSSTLNPSTSDGPSNRHLLPPKAVSTPIQKPVPAADTPLPTPTTSNPPSHIQSQQVVPTNVTTTNKPNETRSQTPAKAPNPPENNTYVTPSPSASSATLASTTSKQKSTHSTKYAGNATARTRQQMVQIDTKESSGLFGKVKGWFGR